jgi:hypothetical protein
MLPNGWKIIPVVDTYWKFLQVIRAVVYDALVLVTNDVTNCFVALDDSAGRDCSILFKTYHSESAYGVLPKFEVLKMFDV